LRATEKSGVDGLISVLAAGHEMMSRLKIGHLILIFALAVLPFAASFVLYYPDERHYTDGALMMLKHGDWLVPKTAVGTPRFAKPILAYWAVAASYLTLGSGVLASRLPFLLACCATLWLTHRLALKLTQSESTARLAAVVLMSHPQFFLCAIRSIPDALLCFFVLLSAYGFLRLMVFEERTAGAFWAAYGGAAGAVLSKGLLGAGIVLFAWAFAFWKERRLRGVAKLIHLPSLVAAGILAASWFGCIFWTHGKAALDVFLGDQVMNNLHGHWWSPLYRAPLFTLVLVFNFLPWSLPVIERWLRRRVNGAPVSDPARTSGEPQRAGSETGVPGVAQKMILAWTAILIVGFALGVNVSLRYLLPATPLMAVLMADWLQGAASARLVFSVRRILKTVLAILVLADAAAFFFGSQWPLPITMSVVTCGWLFSVMVALGWGALWRKSFSPTEALGLSIMLGWAVLFAAAMPMLLPDRAQQLAATLKQTPGDPKRPVLLVGNKELASRVRVLLGKKWTIVQSDKLNLPAAADFDTVLLPNRDVPRLLERGYKVQRAAFSNGPPGPGELWPALKSRRLPAVLMLHGQKYCLATR
jgi:4-amino-4-deoxy-L-arabinose transferase-like glycosyltransferase